MDMLEQIFYAYKESICIKDNPKAQELLNILYNKQKY